MTELLEGRNNAPFVASLFSIGLWVTASLRRGRKQIKNKVTPYRVHPVIVRVSCIHVIVTLFVML